MKKYGIVSLIFGCGIGIVLILLCYFISLQTLDISYENNKIVITEKGYNISKTIDIKEVLRIDYSQEEDILFHSTKIRGPSNINKKISRDQILKKVALSSKGIDTKEFAAGKGYSETFGDCKVYIYWDQYSYIALKTKESYFLINDKDEKRTESLYLQLKEDLN